MFGAINLILYLVLCKQVIIFTQFVAGEKFGIDARNAIVTDEAGAEIDSIEVIRDNDKLFIFENFK